MTTIVWFRRDLRLADHGPLAAACARGRPIVPVYVHDDAGDPWAPGAASRVWLHHSLAALGRDLAARGSPLLLRRGPTVEVLEALAAETGAEALAFNRRHEPHERAREARVRARLGDRLALLVSDDALLVAPERLATGGGRPYRVYTPFWRRLREVFAAGPPQPPPRRLPPPSRPPATLPLAALELLPRIRWDLELVGHWAIGEAGARRRLDAFAADGIEDYASLRDLPGADGVSRLSPHLHFGEISPRQAWHAIAAQAAASGRLGISDEALVWLRQLAWREFAQHLLHHHPATSDAPLREEFMRFPWVEDAAGLARWQRGATGYPIVDAGMRELWRTGWLHNRVRMIVASFLIKDLGVHWREGARWFWDTLVDADLANNTLGWQWTAGCGADAAPYFRIFNPVLQSAKLDPQGHYLRRWLPELAALPTAALHAPWRAAPATLAAAGLRLGVDYPAPILDHAAARSAALARLKRMST
ncbi:MAG TPA: deoxyribodipyrimidine photo-lyase [Gammaproteobacteria bacterium]|nr:deoxyribodipyrimidine photo-lyase [Gammaproteobacteria bacterium]